MDFQNGLQMYVITDRVNAYTYQMPSLVEYYIFARVCNHGFPEWTSNVRYYRPSECLYLSDAISCGVGGTIALPPVFESDQPKYCCAVLELVTMEQKQDFDLETEKVFQALQAADLRINLQPRLRPECFSRDQRAELTEIANVTRAVCQTHRLPLALTWIPCDYTRGTVDDISKLRVRLRDSRMIRKCVFFIERTSCYGDEEMQDIVHACEQLFMHNWQGAAGRAFITYLPSFEPDVKENHGCEYPLAHHARKYNWNAAVAIWLRGSDADYNYIVEFFLPILMKESSEQQDLVGNLKLALRKTCKSLRMFSKEELLWERGSKVSKNNDKIKPAPDPDGNMFIMCADNIRRKVSEVWKWFDKVIEENGAVWAICTGCKNKYQGIARRRELQIYTNT
ncbi:hypothetical protein Peur_063399 [Populus x canadensis]